MDDYLYKGRIEDLDMAFSFCVATGVVDEAVLRHDCDPVSAHLFGRGLACGLLAASLLGPGERLNLHWKYTGTFRTLVVDAGPDATVRGLVSPTDLGAYGGDVHGLYGEAGQLALTRSRGGRVLRSSTTACHLLEVADDLAYAFSVSDQLESALCAMIGFKPDVKHPVDLCKGLLLQALPGCDLSRFEAARERISHPEVRDLLGHKSDMDTHFESLIQAVVRPLSRHPRIHVEDCGPPRFVCTCSRDRMGAVLSVLPAPDRDDIRAKRDDVVIDCRFCRERYRLTVEECEAIWRAEAAAD